MHVRKFGLNAPISHKLDSGSGSSGGSSGGNGLPDRKEDAKDWLDLLSHVACELV